MSEQIIRLCKRLNKFTFEEISLIAETDEAKLLPILNEFVANNKLTHKDGVYFYNKTINSSKQNSKLPLSFQYHSPETISMIVKCFCADIEVDKVTKILNPQKHCISKFYKFFREKICEKQHQELLNYFNADPKNGRAREYLGKTVYLYLYDDKLFVSEKLLKNKHVKDYSNDERLTIKNLYLRDFRKVLNVAYKQFFHLHLAEMIWRRNKEYSELFEELNNLINY